MWCERAKLMLVEFSLYKHHPKNASPSFPSNMHHLLGAIFYVLHHLLHMYFLSQSSALANFNLIASCTSSNFWMQYLNLVWDSSIALIKIWIQSISFLFFLLHYVLTYTFFSLIYIYFRNKKKIQKWNKLERKQHVWFYWIKYTKMKRIKI